MSAPLQKEFQNMSTKTSNGLGMSLVLGFIAAGIAVLTVHQAIVYGLVGAKFLPPTSQPWSTAAIAPFGIPKILNDVFWGGLWGALFAAIWPKIPGGSMWLRGLLYGLMIAVVSNWILLPFIRGTLLSMPRQVFFAGFDPTRMAATLLILGGFGLATGLIYGLLRGRT